VIIGYEAGITVGAVTTVYTGYVTGMVLAVTRGCPSFTAITSPLETGRIVAAATGTTVSATGTVVVAIC